MSDLSDTLSTASALAGSSSSNAPRDVSKQLPQRAVDAWDLAFNAAKVAQDAGLQPVSPNPWPTEAASPSSAQRSAPSAAQPPVSKADTSQEPHMPNVGVALWQGVWHGGRDLAQTGTALGGGRLDAEGQRSAAAAPLQWADLLSPGSKLAPKLAYQIGQSWPTMAGGIAGTGLGIAAAGGPEDPLALVTGPVGGAVGAGMMNGLQSFGNYFGDELHKTPGDADGAYSRALERAKVSGVFSGVAWAAFPARAFQGPLKNMMFQAFGVQPAINMGHQAADNALTGKPLAEGLGNAYTQGAIGTLAIAGGHSLGGEAGKVVSQYKLQVDPNALGANGANIRVVKKAGTGKPAALDAKPARTPLTSAEAVIIDRQAMKVQAQNGKPISGDPFPTNTRPTPGAGQLMGQPETIPPNTRDPDNKFGIRIQNKSLRMAADAGYSVVLQPKKTLGRDGKPLLTAAQQRDLGLDPDKNPDALINGRVFDVYGPTSETAGGAQKGIGRKIGRDNQAHRILLNLQGTDVTPSQLRQYLEKNPINNLKEIILIDQNGNLKNFFPF